MCAYENIWYSISEQILFRSSAFLCPKLQKNSANDYESVLIFLIVISVWHHQLKILVY